MSSENNAFVDKLIEHETSFLFVVTAVLILLIIALILGREITILGVLVIPARKPSDGVKEALRPSDQKDVSQKLINEPSTQHRLNKKILSRIYTMEEIATKEQAIEKEVWILAVTIKYEVSEHYIDAIARNIRNGMRYRYFFSNSMSDVKSDVKRFHDTLRLHDRVPKDQLRSNLEIYGVEESGLLCNITLLDPGIGEHQGFMLPVYTNTSEAFQVDLDEDLYQRMEKKMKAWKKDGEKLFPS